MNNIIDKEKYQQINTIINSRLKIANLNNILSDEVKGRSWFKIAKIQKRIDFKRPWKAYIKSIVSSEIRQLVRSEIARKKREQAYFLSSNTSIFIDGKRKEI